MSHNIPQELKYTDDHEWTQANEEVVTIGITDFAQSALGDIVFVELPEVGDSLEKAGSFGVVESIKSVSDLYSPITGEVVEINEELTDSPEKINEDAYGSWIIKVKASDLSELDALMPASAYEEHCANQY
jgi:glycine cleavage system H protein